MQSDDFKVGQWIIMTTGAKREELSMFGPVIVEDKGLCGLPMKITAVSRPFITVEMPSEKGPLFLKYNISEHNWAKADRRYVNQFKKFIKSLVEKSANSVTTKSPDLTPISSWRG